MILTAGITPAQLLACHAAELLHLEDTEQEREKEQPKTKSGAAAAAAIEAAKGDAAVLKQRRAAWKDPVVAAREAALQASAAAAPAASIPSLHPSAAKADGSSGPAVKSAGAVADASPASRGRRTRAGTGSPQKRGERGAKLAEEPLDRGAEDASEQNQAQRKRTRSGLTVDLEEI